MAEEAAPQTAPIAAGICALPRIAALTGRVPARSDRLGGLRDGNPRCVRSRVAARKFGSGFRPAPRISATDQIRASRSRSGTRCMGCHLSPAVAIRHVRDGIEVLHAHAADDAPYALPRAGNTEGAIPTRTLLLAGRRRRRVAPRTSAGLAAQTGGSR